MNDQKINDQYEHFAVETDHRGVITVTLSVRDRPMNVFDAAVITELERIVDWLHTREDAVFAVFRSGKESGFLAGADVKAIRAIGSAEQADALVTRGQALFQRVERLPMPTLAVLHGPCLGGGLEFSLACTYRVARDNSSTQIGLPEIKLGLIPGWGGTQRLPRLIGCRAALDLILQGRSLDAREAFRLGLIDRTISPHGWDSEIDQFIDDCLSGQVANSAHHRRGGWLRWIQDCWPMRQVMFEIVGRKIASRARHYPALSAAVRAVHGGYDRTSNGFESERREFVQLWNTPTSRNLIDLFLAREAARSLGTWVGDRGRVAHERPIRTLGVVGAGAMGAGIGQLAAARGFQVNLMEVDAAAAEAGRARVEKLFRRLALRKSWPAEQLEAALQSVAVSCDADDLTACDLVIEAVVEQESVKQDVFGRLDRSVQASAILATNTSSLSVDSMATATGRPEKVAGLHFFNPVHRMDLVEVVQGEMTDDETVARLVGFVRALGKTPIVTSDSPGFLVNRILFPYLGEAVMMLREGEDIQTIDQQVRRFGMPMGPLELLDQVGLDVALHVARSLRSVLADSGPVIDPLAVMAEHDRLGKKSGVGFYHYRRGVRRQPAALPSGFPRQFRPSSSDSFVEDGMTAIQRRAVYPMLTEAIRCLQQRVVRHAWAIDLGMVLGTGFAPHTGGPLHLVDKIGPATVLENLRRLTVFYGPRYQPPTLLEDLVESDGRFFTDDGCENLPTKMHSMRLDPTLKGRER